MKTKIISGLVLAVLLISGIVLGIKVYQHKYGIGFKDKITNDLGYIRYNNGEYAMVDSKINEIIGKRFDDIMCVGTNTLVFLKDYVSHFYEPSPDGGAEWDANGNKIRGPISPYMKFQIDDFYGVFNSSYEVIIPPLYREVYYIGNGYFSASVDGVDGLILDSKGKYVHGR